jgi:hypothetical protein
MGFISSYLKKASAKHPDFMFASQFPRSALLAGFRSSGRDIDVLHASNQNLGCH